MTEDEAKTKWCPFAKSRSVVYVSLQKKEACATLGINGEINVLLCIGSECMAWRGHTQKKIMVTEPGETEEKEWYWDPSESAKISHTNFLRFKDHKVRYEFVNHGYCGLAGKP